MCGYIFAEDGALLYCGKVPIYVNPAEGTFMVAQQLEGYVLVTASLLPKIYGMTFYMENLYVSGQVVFRPDFYEVNSTYIQDAPTFSTDYEVVDGNVIVYTAEAFGYNLLVEGGWECMMGPNEYNVMFCK